MGFVQFMESGLGRAARAIVGAALVVIGWEMHNTTGTVLLIVGLLPLAAGLFNFCFFAPLVRPAR